VLDEKRQVGLECRVLAEFFAAISAILDNRDRRMALGRISPSGPLMAISTVSMPSRPPR
jgi:hypothetical protein